nr:dihydroxyacetone kinase subunit DhaL [Spelaeicoccus albus]
MTRFADSVAARREYLTDLDSAIGDADHGTNMTRGMQAVTSKLESDPSETIDALFRAVGMALVSSVGGASGPLYGTFFLRFGGAAAGAATLDVGALGTCLRAGLDGVIARGKAELGDKTMLDAMIPAVDAFDGAADDLLAAVTAARDAAATGRDATEPLTARKGRASYLGDRSVGHVDPGATSTALLFDALAAAVAGE